MTLIALTSIRRRITRLFTIPTLSALEDLLMPVLVREEKGTDILFLQAHQEIKKKPARNC